MGYKNTYPYYSVAHYQGGRLLGVWVEQDIDESPSSYYFEDDPELLEEGKSRVLSKMPDDSWNDHMDKLAQTMPVGGVWWVGHVHELDQIPDAILIADEIQELEQRLRTRSKKQPGG